MVRREKMIITRESEYAMRMIFALADNEIKPVRQISKEEQLPHKWAYKILKKMERAGIVKAYHGVNGGYQLDKKISQISMLDILTINKNTLRFSECAHGLSCSHATHNLNKCIINKEIRRLENAIISELRKRTMDKVIKAI